MVFRYVLIHLLWLQRVTRPIITKEPHMWNVVIGIIANGNIIGPGALYNFSASSLSGQETVGYWR